MKRIFNMRNFKNCFSSLGCLKVVSVLIAGFSSFGLMAADVFADLAKYKNVESTYISGRFSHNRPYWYNNAGEHGIDLRRGFSAMYTYECNSAEAVSKAVSILEDYIKKNPDLELMMKNTNGMEDYRVYEKFNKEDKIVQMIIWDQESPGTCEVVVIDWDKGLEPTKPEYY